MSAIEHDPQDVRRAHRAPGALRAFNDAGVLAAADVHVARRLCQLGGEGDETVMLAAALAVRAPRLGHVHVDLGTIRATAAVDADEPVDLAVLPWPEPAPWVARVAGSPLLRDGGPLCLDESRLYLDRYWREERQVAADLLARAAASPAAVREDVLAAGLARLFARGEDDRQADAAAAAVRGGLAVVAGGPGTGKTTTVARIVALLAEQAAAAGGPAPLVALAAPTGKAAARLSEAVREEAAALPVEERLRGYLAGLGASTLHRLLGRRPGSHSRFRHHRANRLPHDVVIVDETSMVSLSLMARLVEAVRPSARLVLVGDPGQLTSIEAGAVLGDIVSLGEADRVGPVVVLDRVHRFGGGIARLAEAIRAGDADRALEVLAAGGDDVVWLPVDVEDQRAAAALAPVREAAVGAAAAVTAAARAGDAPRAIRSLGAFRVLCAHRRGPHGVSTWTARIEGWLDGAIDGFAAEGRWYPGRPLLVTENDYELRLHNGDAGVVVRRDGDRDVAVFERADGLLELSPARLAAVETVYAMTVHKSQGSQFETAAVLLPPESSRLLTRELLYTAVTRARRRLLLAATEGAIRSAIARPVARASGLRALLAP